MARGERSTREGTAMNIMPPSTAVDTTSPSWPLGPFPVNGRVDSHANSHPLQHQLQHPLQRPQGSSQQQQHPQWHPHPFPQSHRAFGPPSSSPGSAITTTNNLNANNVSVNRPPIRRPHAATTAGRFRSATRVPDLPVLNNLRITGTNVDDSSDSDEDFRSSGARPPQRPPAHRRSMSHPFPSLFSSKKKKPDQMHAGDSEAETADEAGYAPKLGTIKSVRGHRNVPSTGNKDYGTGSCMTCGSLVRWPKELTVFKCTICVTINDLQPPSSGQGQGQGPRRDSSRNSPPAAEERVFSYEISMKVRSPPQGAQEGDRRRTGRQA
ncbi:putative E3 ubiquitin-protein ligase [Neurospora sp. IMI 360204]|nr:putative E3 ubiquitin-protein ligase [Neurospora sp. IMI 360204]